MRRLKIMKFVTDPILIVIVAIINLTPFFWSVQTSFKSERDVYVYPIKLVGFDVTMENYQYVLSGRFIDSLLVSLGYGLVSVLICVVLSSMAAYGFARFNSRMMSVLFFLVIFGIPLASGSSALIVPNYILFSSLGITNKIFTMPLIYITYHLPISIWICMGGMRSIPIAVEEAAIIDGCKRSYIIFNLIPRLNKPALACSALFTFISAWNEFLVSSVLTISPQYRGIQVAVYYFMGYYGIQWGPLMTATALSLIPIIFLFAFLGKQLISGLTAGAVKG